MSSKFNITGNSKAVLPTERDRAMIDYVWKYRVASFRMIHQLFYPEASFKTCYNRLYKFRNFDFLEVKVEDGAAGRYFILGKRGLAFFLRENGLESKPQIYQPQSLKHDFLASIILQGDWWMDAPGTVTLVTEQELLCPIGEDLHKASGIIGRRPDGLWIFEIGPEKKFIALEVEIHAKTEADYIPIIRAYDNAFPVDKIVWVVRGQGLIEKIHSIVVKHSSFKNNSHLFLNLNDVVASMWSAKFKNSAMKEITLAQFLSSYQSHLPKPPRNSLENPPEICQVSRRNQFINPNLLDLSISPRKSKGCKNV